jgi:hypothetical protein
MDEMRYFTMVMFWDTRTGRYRIEHQRFWRWPMTYYPHWRTGTPRPAYRPKGVTVGPDERVFIRQPGWLWEMTPDGAGRGTARRVRDAVFAVIEPLWHEAWCGSRFEPDDPRLSRVLDPVILDQCEAMAK